MRRVRCEQDAFLRDFCKGITLLVIGIAKSRKNTSIAKYITLRISVTSWDIAFFIKGFNKKQKRLAKTFKIYTPSLLLKGNNQT